MLKTIPRLLCAAAWLLSVGDAYADNYGNAIIPVGPTQQASASTGSAGVTLTATADYVLVWNEGSVFVYVTCTAGTATVPGGSGPNSTPVGPSTAVVLNNNAGLATCAAVTATGSALVDFTPINLF